MQRSRCLQTLVCTPVHDHLIMENLKVQIHIKDWLAENHALATHVDILKNVLTVGKTSHRWVEAIQRCIAAKSLQRPGKGDVKRACRAILEEMSAE